MITLMRMVMALERMKMVYGYGEETRVEPVRREQLGAVLKRHNA